MPQALGVTVAKLRRLAGWSALAQRTDRQLLEAFAATGDEAAFTLLVQRHGALVLGVTRRVLGNVQDAEDAFQATFLVLARKAGSVAWQDSIRNWLHGVAFRVASKARTLGAKRRLKERQAHGEAPPAAAETWHELRGILDQELAGLPAKYRAPLILCYLEGKTRDEAAEELGWSPGSVKGRLERGREMLRQRLQQRGLTLPAALCAGFLLDQSAFASVPASLAQAAVQAGVPFAAGNLAGVAASASTLQLAQGVLAAMLIAKLKITGLALSFALLFGVGGAWIAQTGRSGGVSPLMARAAAAEIRHQGTTQEREEPKAGQERREERREERKEGQERREERGVRGIIKKLDLKAGALTIQPTRDGEEGERTYSLAGKDVRVQAPVERETTLDDLKPGMRVLLSLNDNNDVAAIRVEPIMQVGFLLRADADKRTITLRGPREGERGGETTLKLAREARLLINNRPGELGDLQAGMRLQLGLDLDKQTVFFLSAARAERDGERPRGEPERPRERDGDRNRVVGAIVDVDHAKGTINLLVGREGDLTLSTYAVAKDAPVKIMLFERPMQDLTFAQLAKPVNASLVLADDKTVAAIHVAAPTQRGRIKAVDPAKRTVTLAGERGDTTLELAADAKVHRGRQEVELADLGAGTQAVIALSLDRRRILGIQLIAGDRERGADRERER